MLKRYFIWLYVTSILIAIGMSSITMYHTIPIILEHPNGHILLAIQILTSLTAYVFTGVLIIKVLNLYKGILISYNSMAISIRKLKETIGGINAK